MLVFVRGAGSSSQWSSRRGDDDEYDLDSKPARDAARGFAERGVQHFTEARVLCRNHSRSHGTAFAMITYRDHTEITYDHIAFGPING